MIMMMIQISEKKRESLADLTEKVLHYAGKLMSCVENIEDDSQMGERSYRHMGMRDMDYDDMPERDYGNRGDAYGDRMPNRYGNRRYR